MKRKFMILTAVILILALVAPAEAGLFSRKKKKAPELTAAEKQAGKNKTVLDEDGTYIEGESSLNTGVLPEGGMIETPEQRKAAQEQATAAAAAVIRTQNAQKEDEIPDVSGPEIQSVRVEGNTQVVSEHILSVITSKVGGHLSEARLRKDASSIFELGFFANVDYKVKDVRGGVEVVFVVQENPIVESITFTGNSVFKQEELMKVVFTSPGSIFNRTFFRNDLQRIKEKYQQAGYAMANVEDVRIDGSNVNVIICEPRIKQIIIQGNKITKTHIIKRYLKVKEGELFNSNKLRMTLNRLQGLGFFNDVNVNFEPTDKKDEVVIVITVEEGKTSRIGFNVSYGSQSGLGGGVTYSNYNIGGKGLKLDAGVLVGRRGDIYLTLEQPYLDNKVWSWRMGVYRRNWDDLYYYDNSASTWLFQYDRKTTGAFIGAGKKIGKQDSKYNWYLTLDYHKVYNETNSQEYAKWKWPYITVNSQYYYDPVTIADDLGDGRYYSATFSLRRFNLDEYSPYTKGDSESIYIQPGKATVDNTTSGSKDYSYVKYWLEAKAYLSLEHLLGNVFDYFGIHSGDIPPLLAIRLMGGTATGDVPFDEMYKIGGDYTLRGYRDEYFHGEQMLLGNFELRVPVQKSLSLVGFFDVGRAWRKNSGIGFGSDIGRAPGIGVRLKTPFGNVRLDYADGEEGRFHFGFGEMF